MCDRATVLAGWPSRMQAAAHESPALASVWVGVRTGLRMGVGCVGVSKVGDAGVLYAR